MKLKSARSTAFRTALSGLLLAMMLVLGYVESLIPTPIQGVKLGLSNGVLIFAVYMLDLPTAWILMSLKVFLSGLMFGGVTAMLYAFAGGVLSLAAMSLLSRFRSLHPAVVSMAGGALHNVGQLGMAMWVLPTPHMVYYLGYLIPVGLACGALTGVASALVMKHLKSAGMAAKKETGRASPALIVIAAIVALAVGFFAWRSQIRPSGVVITTSTDLTPAVTMIPGNPLHGAGE